MSRRRSTRGIRRHLSLLLVSSGGEGQRQQSSGRSGEFQRFQPVSALAPKLHRGTLMTLNRILAPLLLSLSCLAGCAGGSDSSSDEEGSAEAWAAVDAGDCTPDCSGRNCGLDPICGVTCGACSTGQSCNEKVGRCEAVCVPDCTGRTCGLDPVCGVSCGSCATGSTCNSVSGTCQAAPPTHHSCPWKRRHGRR